MRLNRNTHYYLNDGTEADHAMVRSRLCRIHGDPTEPTRTVESTVGSSEAPPLQWRLTQWEVPPVDDETSHQINLFYFLPRDN